jgi:hypothetical protein
MFRVDQKRWENMSPAARSLILVLGVVQIGLLVAALRDIRARTPEEINGNRKLWTAALFVNFVGPISYFIWGRKRR